MRRFTPAFSREHALELEVVAEGARPDVLQALGRQEDGRSGQGDHADALAVAQGLRADRVTGDTVEDADQVRRHHARPAVEPADGELVLEGQLEGLTAEVVESVELGGASEKSFGRAAGDVADLAAEHELTALGVDHRLDGVAMLTSRGLHRLAQADRLGRRVEDAALLDFFAGARRLAGGRDRADLDAGLAREALHPLPRRGAGDDDRVVANVRQRQGIHREVVNREAGHLRLGEGAAHAIGVDDGQAQHRGSHERLQRVAAADLERHDRVEVAAAVLLHHPHGARDRLRIGEPLLADQRRAHVRDDRHPCIVGQSHWVEQRAHDALAIELAHVQERQVGAASAAGAEDPGTDRQGLDLGRGDGTEGHRTRMLSSRHRDANADEPELIMRLVTAVLAVLIAAAPAQAFERVGDRKILVFAGRQEVPTIDPSIKYDWSIRMAQQSLYDALVKYVGNPPEIQPWLAEKWESSPDARSWTFHLVKNAKFHNGDPVTAEAVRFSFARTLKLNQGPAWMLSDFLKEDGIKIVNDSTIQFNLTQPYAPFLSLLPWWYVMNPKQVTANEQAGDMGQKWLTTNSAGSGPFKIKRWEQGVLYELEAVDAYWKGWLSKDHIGGVIYKIVRESAAQRAALIRGEADIAEGLSPEDFDQVAKMPGIVVPNFPGMTTFGIKMNTQNGATKDANLRKAVCYAFDYDALVKIYNGNAVLQTSPFPNATRGYAAVPGIYRQDLAKAKEFLAKSAHPNGGIELEYVYVQGLEEERKMGLVLIDNLQKLNITVKMVPLIWPNMVARGAQVHAPLEWMAVPSGAASTDRGAVADQ